jgi:purine-cytosine permease-like protein
MKKRKSLDELLGINGFLIWGIIGNYFIKTETNPIISILSAIAPIAGISAIYYLIKKRKILDKQKKTISWILVILWIFSFGIF